MTEPAIYGTGAPPPPPPTGEDQRPKGLSITALVLGIIGLVAPCLGDFGWIALPCAIAAIIVGAVALSKEKRGEQGGRGMAVAGIVLGIIALLLGILVVLMLLGLIAGVAWLGGEAIENANEPVPPPEPIGLLRDTAEMLRVHARHWLS